MRREAIQEKSFADLYGSEQVEADLRRVAELERRFDDDLADHPEQREITHWGKLFEAFLHSQINQPSFFGEQVVGIKTSRYDDYVHGVDEVAIYPRPEGTVHMGLAIDFTFGSPDKKFERVMNHVREGKLARVKYFQAEIPGFHFRGELKTPKVIVAISRRGVQNEIVDWVSKPNPYEPRPGLGMLMLRQIADQSDVFARIASETVAHHYRAVNAVAERAISGLRASGVQMGILKNDSSHLMLMDKIRQSL